MLESNDEKTRVFLLLAHEQRTNVYLLANVIVVELPRTSEDDTQKRWSCVEGGRVDHTWRMIVVSHSYCGFGGGRDGGGGW